MIKRYKLLWGIHKGTMMSRDVCDNEFFDSKADAIQHVKNSLNNTVWSAFGYKLWFANLIDTQTGKEELNILPACPYQ